MTVKNRPWTQHISQFFNDCGSTSECSIDTVFMHQILNRMEENGAICLLLFLCGFHWAAAFLLRQRAREEFQIEAEYYVSLVV